MNTDIVIYVEDPGAANMVLGLVDALAQNGLAARLFAGGTARRYLTARDEAFVDVDVSAPGVAASTPLLVVGTSEAPTSPAHDLVIQARAARVLSVGLVDRPASASSRFRGTGTDPIAFAPDRLIVPDESTRDAFAALGIVPARVALAINPALERARARAATLVDEDRIALRERLFGLVDGPVIVFLSEVSDGLDPQDFRRNAEYTLQGRGGRDDRTGIVFETLVDAAAALRPRPHIVVRLHPKETTADWAADAAEALMFNDDDDPLTLCHAADLVVGMTTMLLSECRTMGIDTLSILPRKIERGWLADVTNRRIKCVHTADDVRDVLAQRLTSPLVGRRLDTDIALPTVADTLIELVAKSEVAYAPA